MYLLGISEEMKKDNIDAEIILVDLLAVSIIWFLYNYVMTFFFEEFRQKHHKIYEILENRKQVLLFVILFGLIASPLISIPILFFPLFFFYTIYKKTRQSSKVLKYFTVYNLLILSYTINLIQLIGFELYQSVFIDIVIFCFQMTLYIIIWREVNIQ